MTKNRPLMALIAAVAVGALFFHFALQPKRKEAASVEKQVTEAQAKLDGARQLLDSNLDARAGFKTDYASVVRLGKAVPGDDDVRSLVVQLDTAAKHAHIDFQSIEVGGESGGGAAATPPAAGVAAPLPPGATIGPAGFPIMPFSFGFRGQFFRLGTFFRRLDTFVRANNQRIAVTGRLLTVDAVKLEPDTSGFPNIKATVSATSYLVSPLEGPTGGASATGPAVTGAPPGSAPATPGAPGAAPPPTTTAMSTGATR